MLKFYEFTNGKMVDKEVNEQNLKQSSIQPQWIDALDTQEAERSWLEALLHTELPESDEVEEIEYSARFFVDSTGINIYSLFLTKDATNKRMDTSTVAFILKQQRLITVREEEISDFNLIAMRAKRGQLPTHSATDLLFAIFDQKIETMADYIELLHRELEEVSSSVLEKVKTNLETTFDTLASLEDTNGKIRLCLMDTQRSISFMQRQFFNDDKIQKILSEISRDINSLMSHTNFLFEKINFLMDTAQGFINIEQNKIIKIFSIVAVLFMPPTMIASIYGMNFHIIPELDWRYGYLFALGLMVGSVVFIYWYFRHRRWL